MQNLLTKFFLLLSAGFYYVIHSGIQSSLYILCKSVFFRCIIFLSYRVTFLCNVLCQIHYTSESPVRYFLNIYFIYSPAGFQESLSSLFSISFRSTVYATFTSLSFLMINSESPYSEPLSAQSYVYPSLVHGYFPSK